MIEGPIYPFRGLEILAVLVAVAAWILWTVWQARFENETYRREAAEFKPDGTLSAGEPPDRQEP